MLPISETFLQRQTSLNLNFQIYKISAEIDMLYEHGKKIFYINAIFFESPNSALGDLSFKISSDVTLKIKTNKQEAKVLLSWTLDM